MFHCFCLSVCQPYLLLIRRPPIEFIASIPLIVVLIIDLVTFRRVIRRVFQRQRIAASEQQMALVLPLPPLYG